MREQDALEMIDSYLDDDSLTDQQIEELTLWLKQNPQHAQRAFHRIYLHTYLRRRLQARRLTTQTNSTEVIRRDADDGPTIAELIIPQSRQQIAPTKKSPRLKRTIIACTILLCALLIGWLSVACFSSPPRAMEITYEGFNYPATSIPAPAPKSPSWPTSGGLEGLAGGTGWASPWLESGSKVAVIVDHAGELSWDPKDMRKFKPLGHRDATGKSLLTSGFQMRTPMGSRSMTSRKLDLNAFPDSMKDESGLGADGTVIWFSFLAQSFASAGDVGRFSYFQIGSRKASGFRLGKVSAAPSGNWTAMGLLTGAQVNLRSSAVPSGERTLLVTRLEFRPGAEDAAVWINPSLGTEPDVDDATLRLSIPDFRFDGVSINANYSTDFDEIRFGQSFRAVAPVK